ncbi:hypothetical protein CRUP_019825, partial [Coryphaenoides rupestris]
MEEEEEEEQQEQQQQALSPTEVVSGRRAAEPAAVVVVEDRCQGDGGNISMPPPVRGGAGQDPAMLPGEQPAGGARESAAQHIHAAQLELLGERAARHAPRSPDTRLDGRGESDGRLDLATDQQAPPTSRCSQEEEEEEERVREERVREEARGQRVLLEERHREELELDRLRAHYQQLASDAEERRATQLP